MSKKFLSLLICIIAVISLSCVVNAEETVSVYVNGEFLETDQPAIIYQDRTMVPLRAICEKLNCTVDWDGNSNTALIENGITMVAAQINNYTLTKKDRRVENGESRNITIDVPPMIMNGRTLVPARAIAESLNAKVEWNGAYNRVDITMEYDYISDYKDGYSVVSKDKKQGIIDKNGEIIVPVQYDNIHYYSNGIFIEGYASVGIINDNGSYSFGYVNEKGQVSIPLKYSEVTPFSHGVACVSIRNSDGSFRSGLIDHEGKILLPFEYNSIAWSGEEELAIVDKNGTEYIVNSYGQKIADLPSKNYDGFTAFSEGLAWVSKDYKCGYIDVSGKEVIPMIYDYVWGDTRDLRRNFENGVAPARISGKHGYIDVDGNEIIPIIHEASGAVSEDVVCLKLNGKWAYYDIWGNQITAYIFDEASEFDNGLATVSLNGALITIDKETLYENQSIKP